MNNEFFEALALLEKEKGIPVDYLLEKIKAAIAIAVKRDYGGTENALVDIDPTKGSFHVAIRKDVVDHIENEYTDILLEDALKHSKHAEIGGTVEIALETKQFGRIAAQAAKHVIRQGIREAEKGQLLQEFQSKEHEIVSAIVSRIDSKKGIASLEIGRNEAVLPKSEQVPTEELVEGQRIKVYVVEVTNSEKGPRIMISRTHPGLVKRLFEIEVPEIYDGTVEIKAISREAGSRTKLAVWSKDENVDAVGSCIGPKGSRVAKIVDELDGEKIDVVKYSEDPAQFISAALSPADVVSVEVDPEGARMCKVTVPDNQLSLAIGNKGQNARLAAKLTGWKIDIRPESGFFGEEVEE
ncbi:NusA antitermination factor [Hydrogenoanaerobacterium saccharovorans]|uniref:Transcription termination/antitermination protein NusA n=1 Tax=Hydrogenoanaerobacterium saccharovorans TaxID=474960 RepID=A0A1H8ASV2_9FIRM|nr:transcription termination factor NusA [Hydrogenoanaerobacterium saccharovorans]RPF47765.1 NusA antitermination factor [Hydrogenoanaerobacterium saccharovorans]SEM73812.1 NusA antitermination factor [Hydrogenoanaerobacterium saccharovorans]